MVKLAVANFFSFVKSLYFAIIHCIIIDNRNDRRAGDIMPDKLFTSMGFSICGMVFLILVFIMYMSKKKFKNFENNIYFLMFFITFLLLINELVYIYAMYAELDGGFLFLPVKPLCYSYIFLSIVWLSFLIMYIWSKLFDNNDSKTVKTKRIIMIIFMSLVIILVFSVSVILELKYPTSNSNLYVFSGPAVYVLYIIGIVALIMITVAMFFSGKKIPIYQKIPVLFCLLALVVMIVAQLILDYDFNNLAYFFVFLMTTLYFTIESQDYKLIDELEKKKAEVEIANTAQTEFLSNMSHEIRTPLNTILGFSDSLLTEQNLTEEIVNRDVSMIYEASDNLLDLINKILAISKLESGEESVTNERYSIKKLVSELDDEMIRRTDNRDIKIVFDIASNISDNYYGDYNKIYNSLLYIADNSLKYTNFGSVSLKVFGTKIDDTNFELVFKILNTGTEMSADKFNVSFNDFVKLGDKTQNTIDSSSLGLIIAKRYIDLLGGTIEFMSNDINKVQYLIKINQKYDGQIEEL